ncbi:expressed protein [Phakopsora pachyrhizi]|uniref:Expressed protein n=1 Tax=Phakopsora pachyrhizi TaxID=170000 RepID=A0AAV0AMP4_PHAPC|nr:expressed protein [Phakopsora pachyrhizi]
MQPVIEAGSKNPNNSSPNPVNTSYDSEAKPKETHKSVLGGSRLSEPRQMTLEAEEPFEKNDDAMKTAIEAVSENPKNRLSTPENAIYDSEAELKETNKNTSGSSSGTTKSSSPFADDAYSFKQDPLEFLPEKHDSDGGTGSHSNSSRKGTDSPPMLPGKWPSSDFLAKNNNIGSYSTQHQTANLRLSSSLGPDAVSSQACTLSSQKFLAAEKTGDVLCSPTLNNFKTEQSLNSTPTLAQSNLPPAASARCPQSLQNNHSGLNSPVAAVLLSPASLVNYRMASTALSSQKTQNHLVHSQSPLQLNTNHMPQSPINNNFSSQSPINQNPKPQNQQLNCFYTQASCSHNPRSAMKSSITTPIISHIHHPVPTTTQKRSKFSSPTSSPLFDVQSFGQILPSDRLVSYRQSEKSLAESQHHELLDNEQRQDLNSKAAMEYYEQARSRASSAEVIRTIESSRVLLRETKAKNQAQLPGLLQNRLPTRLHGDLSKSSISIHGTTLSDMENTDATLHSATVIGFSQTTSPSQVKIYTLTGHLSSLSTSKTNSPVLGCDAPILTKTETVSASPALGGKKVRVED